MPCDTRFELENDGEKAEHFVKKIIDDDEVPSIYHNMSPELQSALIKIIHAAYSLPETSRGNARSSISSAVSFFNDFENGNLRSDINQPITSVFAEISAGPTGACQGKHCAASTSSAQSCSLPTNIFMAIASPTETLNKSFTKPASTGMALSHKSTPKVTMPSVPKSSSSPETAFSNISRPSSPIPTVTPESRHASFGSRISSYPFGSTSIWVWAVIILGILGVAVLL